ncbi:MAG TPA: DUF1385 domain-containing protein [Acidimicrobiales bacterium]|nr:DUF1385 domain-containing protein [Acidimicrobiales bacterium]
MDGERAAQITTRVGGQAVIEGVLMRAGDQACVAVRRPDGGIETRRLTVPGWARRYEGQPFARGLAALGESLVVGIEALRWSEGVAGHRPADKEPAPLWLLLAISLVAVLGLVVFLPATLAGIVAGGTMWFGVVEAVARVVVLGGYVGLASRRPEVRRVFEYHGAEHLVVGAHEAGGTMQPSALRGGSLLHPRCGTSFLLVVAAVAAIAHPLLPHDPVVLRFVARILVVPLVAAVAYEVLTALGRVAGHRPGGRLDRALLWPQRFTTRRPDDDQVEVAIAALEGALAPGPVVRTRRDPVSASPTGSSIAASPIAS